VKSILLGEVKERMTAYVEVLQVGLWRYLRTSVQKVFEG
jgi:hypothetical protein